MYLLFPKFIWPIMDTIYINKRFFYYDQKLIKHTFNDATIIILNAPNVPEKWKKERKEETNTHAQYLHHYPTSDIISRLYSSLKIQIWQGN